MEITCKNIGTELNRWFSKTIFNFSIDIIEDEEIFKETLDLFLFDYQRYFPNDNIILLQNILNKIELQGILLYRLARNYFLLNRERDANFCSLLGRFLSGFEIYYSAEIGKALKINHGLGMVVGARVKIGDNALLHQGITFGDKNGGRPVIGNNVIIYAGAKIIGKITIGDNCVLAANTVCFVNIPDNKTVVGIPARIIDQK